MGTYWLKFDAFNLPNINLPILCYRCTDASSTDCGYSRMERVPCYAKSIHQNVTSRSHCVWRYVNYMAAIPIRYHGASQRGQRWELHQVTFLYCSLIEDWYWNLNYWMLIITNSLACGACYEFNFATWSKVRVSLVLGVIHFSVQNSTTFDVCEKAII